MAYQHNRGSYVGLSSKALMAQNMYDVVLQCYSKILFVHPDGNNADGSNWVRAFSTIQAAVEDAPSGTTGVTLICVASGDYDVDCEGYLEIDKRIHIRGVIFDNILVSVTNTHASATGIFDLTTRAIISNLFLFCLTNLNGIRISTGADGSNITQVTANCILATQAVSGIILNGISTVKLINIAVSGNQTYVTGFDHQSCRYLQSKNCIADNCLIGYNLGNDSNNRQCSIEVDLLQNALGINIQEASTYCEFYVGFTGNTANLVLVDSSLTNHIIIKNQDHKHIKHLPDSVVGITVTGGGSSDTYGSWTEIIGSSDTTKPFKVVGIVAHDFSATIEMYSGQLSIGAGSHIFYIGLMHGTSVQSGGDIQFETEVFPAGTSIQARVRSETANKTVDIFLLIEEI